MAGTVFTTPCSYITRGDIALQSQLDGLLKAPTGQGGITDPFVAVLSATCSSMMMKRSGGSGKHLFRGEPIAKFTGVLYIIHIPISVPYKPPLKFFLKK